MDPLSAKPVKDVRDVKPEKTPKVKPPKADKVKGCWMAYTPGSDSAVVVPFAEEIDALRYALPMMMVVKFAAFGDEGWKTRTDVPVVP